MKEKKTYITSDGVEYGTKDAAFAHENVEFIKSKGFTEALLDYHVKAQESLIIKQKVRLFGLDWRKWQTGYINAMLDTIERLEQNKFRKKDLEAEEAKEILRWKNIEKEGLPKEFGSYQVYAKFDHIKAPEIYDALFYESQNLGFGTRASVWSISVGWEKESLKLNANKTYDWAKITHWRKSPMDIPSDGEEQ